MNDTAQLLRLYDIERICGLSRSSIYRLAAAGKFPRPVKLAERCAAWKAAEIRDWIDSRLPSPQKAA